MNEGPCTSTWDDFMDLWYEHGRSLAFERRVVRAVEIVTEGVTKGRLFAAISGGKDSVAVAAVLAEAALLDVPCVHAFTELNTPEMNTVAVETCRALNLALEVIEPASDLWEFLRSLPAEPSILDPKVHVAFRNFCSAGSMLVAHMYGHAYSGSISGMRADESRGRRLNRIFRGPLYQIKVDGMWMCLPIVDWSARDVFAIAVRHGLPIHPHYRRLLERFHVDPESPASRVDNLLVEDGIAARGAMLHASVLYPELWRKMVVARPELRREV